MIKNMQEDIRNAGTLIKYWRTHLDVFCQTAFAPLRLTPTQKVMVRAIGNNFDVKIVANRGYGKSFVTAVAALGLACLYPGTLVAVVSGTAQQAAITLQKLKLLADTNKNIANELSGANSRSLVSLQKDKGKATLKNGSVIESFAMQSLRGRRAKIVIQDEVALIDQNDLEAIVSPIKNFRRQTSFENGFKDYSSKTISITSAVEKTNSFYNEFLRVAKEMGNGVDGYFAMALNYEAAIDDGITDAEYFQKQRQRMAQLTFEMEYNSIFLGSNAAGAFPHDLTNPCRVLQKVELQQPKNSKSRYVISIDIATSDADYADNTIITVLKFTQRTDGSLMRKQVYIRSLRGQGLDVLANEVRDLYHNKFPNCEKIIYDARGLGDAFDRFMDSQWVDPLTGRQYPPLVTDQQQRIPAGAIAALHPVRAVQTYNQRIATNLRIALQKRLIQLPVSSRVIRAKKADVQKDKEPLTKRQLQVFYEADAQQVECSNVVAKISASGNVIYDCKPNQHKDRYSSLAMANDYIAELQKQNIKKKQRGTPCIGFAVGYELR